MDFKKIDVGFEKIDKILHVADIHIRNYQRHKEYRRVFRQLYKEVNALPKNAIVYVGGDIVHSKTDISPELIDLTTEFFKNLADRRHTIVITGNHDANLNNSSRLDSLSPIISALDHPQLHYLKDSGVYRIADVAFTVFGIFDDPSTFIKSNSFEAETKVALFHGAVDQSKTDKGYVVSSDNLKISMFDGYDMSMLGDIHKRQFYDKEKRILQVGSTLQQNFGESFENHGCAIWDVKTRKASFVNFKNDFGFYTVDVDNGVLPNIDDIPKYPRVRIRAKNTTQSQLKEITKTIKTKCRTTDIVITRTDGLDAQNKKTRKIVKDIRDVSYQNTLLEEYITDNHNPDIETIQRIQNINRELNKRLPDIDVSRGINWNPKTFEFENMFSYGKGNTIDFSKTEDVVGIFAPNHAGKSAIFDALMFCLFNKCSRTFSASNVINNKKNNFKCKLNFEIDGVDYFIERRGKRNKDGKSVRVDVDFWMIGEDGNVLSLNGEQRRYTDRNISGYLGIYEDFVLTAMSMQNNNTGFIDKPQPEKKNLLSKFLDIFVFEELYRLANEEIKSVQILLKNFKKVDYAQNLLDEEEALGIYKKEYDVLDVKKKELDKEQLSIDKQIRQKTGKLKTISSTSDLSILQAKKENVNDLILEDETKLKKYEGYELSNQKKLKDFSDNLLKYNLEQLNKDISLLELEEKNNNRIQREIELLKVNVKNKLDLISKLDSHEYDPNCEYCCNNEFVKTAEKAQKDLEQDKITSSSLLAENNVSQLKIDSFSEIREKLAEYNALVFEQNKYKRFDSELRVKTEKRKNSLMSNKHSLLEINNEIKTYHKNEKAIEHNRQINADLSLLESEKEDVRSKISANNLRLRESWSDVSICERNILEIQNTMKEAHDLELKLKCYEYYLDAIRRDGIPYEIIAETLPYIEEEVNNTLSQIVDFQIHFDVDGKDILSYIKYSDDNMWPLEMTSGMEKFISSLAIRVALIKISNLPRPNFLIVDEGFGNLDSQSLSSLSLLFDYLKTEFDFIMIISHIDIMKDMVDGLIEIEVSSNTSKVRY